MVFTIWRYSTNHVCLSLILGVCWYVQCQSSQVFWRGKQADDESIVFWLKITSLVPTPFQNTEMDQMIPFTQFLHVVSWNFPGNLLWSWLHRSWRNFQQCLTCRSAGCLRNLALKKALSVSGVLTLADASVKHLGGHARIQDEIWRRYDEIQYMMKWSCSVQGK